jgi:outer membrane protein OmpA-like peptidoglycan-associated protein
MKPTASLMIALCAGLLAGCAASVPPTELVNARQAYQHATAGQAALLVPAELHKAQEALAIAEKSFLDEPQSFRTRDLAYVADRKAKMAEALATIAAGNATTAKANKEYQATQTEIVKNTKEDLAASERSGVLKAEQLAAEQQTRIDAEKRAADAQAELARLAAVKEEARGLVITLSGSVLFASSKSELLPAAQSRLNQVAEALMATKERKLTVEGHTDSQGSSSYNQVLSQRRADAVRSYIISRGYPAELIQAQGIGKDRPVADNGNPEGRANNRRVEIIVDRAPK